MTPDELVAEVARQYDNDEGDLTRAALARLAWRKARSGKVCARCGAVKQTAEFGLDVRKKDGIESRCKACRAANSRSVRRLV